MYGDRQAATEVDEQVLGAPPQGLDAPARHTRQLARPHSLAQSRVAHPHPFDHVTWQQRLEAPAKHLDLWQLGHAVMVPGYAFGVPLRQAPGGRRIPSRSPVGRGRWMEDGGLRWLAQTAAERISAARGPFSPPSPIDLSGEPI